MSFLWSSAGVRGVQLTDGRLVSTDGRSSNRSIARGRAHCDQHHCKLIDQLPLPPQMKSLKNLKKKF